MHDTTSPTTPLNETQMEQLDELLTQLAQDNEDNADLLLALGYVTALSLQPEQPAASQWLPQLVEATPSASLAQVESLLLQAQQTMSQSFYQGQGIELPFEPEWAVEQAELISDWCCGFMQAVFEQEASWFDSDESDMAELLLPIMALSGLFADEEDFAEMETNQPLMNSFAQQLPELLLDIYCQLNAPEEKTSPVSKPKNSKKHLSS